MYPSSMAAASRMIPRSSVAPAADPETIFEFDESEVWASSGYDQAVWQPNQARKVEFDLPKKLLQPRRAGNGGVVRATASSLPVNVPDWSKILRDGDRRHGLRRGPAEEEEDDDDDNEVGQGADRRVPPHEYLARRRGASFSVHEGVGRTLKGRDLRQVRNAVWEKVGFED